MIMVYYPSLQTQCIQNVYLAPSNLDIKEHNDIDAFRLMTWLHHIPLPAVEFN